MTILEYRIVDLLFAHWLRRKREMMSASEPVPAWLDDQLDALRPLRNPHCSVFVLDNGPLYSV